MLAVYAGVTVTVRMRQMNAKNRLGGTGHVINDSANHLADRLRKASIM